MKIVIEHIAADRLHPAPRNARIHSRAQRRKIRRSIEQFGFLVPVVIDDSNRIVAGHARVEEASGLGITEIPAVRASHLSPAQVEAFALAENRISDDARFCQSTLHEIFIELQAVDIDFDLADTGFELPEIDLILLDQDEPAEPPIAAVDRTVPPVSRMGDCWRISDHVIICGDARDWAAYDAVLGNERAQLVICDAPYDLPIQGTVSGLGRIKHAEFPMASGEMGSEKFTSFLSATAEQLVAASIDGAIHFLFMDHRHMTEMLQGAGPHYSELKNLCVWVKRSGGMGSLYRSQHELVFVFKAGTAPHVNNVELGRHGRNRTNVWEYAGANSFGTLRDDLSLHPTIKPIDMLADAILDCSNRGAIVLDPFIGSGSTILAAQRTGRRGRGIELDPYYVDLAVKRVSKAVGKGAVLDVSGASFEEIAHARANPGWGEAA